MRDEPISMGHAAVNLWATVVLGPDRTGLTLLHSAMAFAKKYVLEREFFAVGPNVWGRGQSAALAKEAMRKANGGRLPRQYVIKSCPAGTEISLDNGGLMWPGFLAEMDVRPPYVVDHRGFGRKALEDIACTCKTQPLFSCVMHAEPRIVFKGTRQG